MGVLRKGGFLHKIDGLIKLCFPYSSCPIWRFHIKVYRWKVMALATQFAYWSKFPSFVLLDAIHCSQSCSSPSMWQNKVEFRTCGDPAPLGILGFLFSAFLWFVQQIFTECDDVSGLHSVRALQEAVHSHSRGIWASSEIRKGIPEKVPVILRLEERWKLTRGKGARVGVGSPNQKRKLLMWRLGDKRKLCLLELEEVQHGGNWDRWGQRCQQGRGQIL